MPSPASRTRPGPCSAEVSARPALRRSGARRRTAKASNRGQGLQRADLDGRPAHPWHGGAPERPAKSPAAAESRDPPTTGRCDVRQRRCRSGSGLGPPQDQGQPEPSRGSGRPLQEQDVQGQRQNRGRLICSAAMEPPSARCSDCQSQHLPGPLPCGRRCPQSVGWGPRRTSCPERCQHRINRGVVSFARSHLQRHGVDFVSRVAGPLVNTLNSVGRACLGQAVDKPAVRVRPRLLENDPFLILNGKVGVVSLCQTVGGNYRSFPGEHP